MALQSPSRFFKCIRPRYQKKDLLSHDWREKLDIPPGLRGLYVLYRNRKKSKKVFDVVYVGVGGVKGDWGVGARLRTHARSKKRSKWTHFSIFEAHDNISGSEILEFEGLLLQIFKNDSRVKLVNRQFDNKAFKEIAKGAAASA